MDGPKLEFPLVAIGASAGGLESLRALFGAYREPAGCAFVVVQHLSADYDSVMDELLAPHTPVPVSVARDGERLRRDHIYLAPAQMRLGLKQGCFSVRERDSAAPVHLPIDYFFEQVADVCGSDSIAVVLSGTGSDGSVGVTAISRVGGFVLAESPGLAQFDGMPRSAINTGCVSMSLAAPRLAAAAVRHMQDPETLDPLEFLSDDEAQILELLKENHGVDFTLYKPSTVLRRMDHQLQQKGCESLGEFLAGVDRHPEWLDDLYSDLCIGVTFFFRDSERFEQLAEQGLGPLVETSADDPVRVWVPGCATGEEAYSIAILLWELFEANGKKPNFRIFATDVYGGALDHATTGVYDPAVLQDVDGRRLERFFARRAQGYEVIPALRNQVSFVKQDLLRDPPFTKVHLVSCRNLLIYFNRAAQENALGFFHFALREQGLLFLGPSEGPPGLSEAFETIGSGLFRRTNDGRRIGLKALTSRDVRLGKQDAARLAPEPRRPPGGLQRGLLRTYDELLDLFMPPAILLNAEGMILDSFAGAQHFLSKKPRRPSNLIFDVVDDRLATVLSGALRRAGERRSSLAIGRFDLARGNEAGSYQLTLTPIKHAAVRERNFLLRFDAQQPAPAETVEEARTQPVFGGLSPNPLVAELDQTRDDLSDTIEQLASSNDDLQGANEELQAANEELQTTNEELHSVNEELHTVNAAHAEKMAELSEVNRDVSHLLESTDIAVVYVDAELRIRKFTPLFGECFGVSETDLGRPLEGFGQRLDYPDIYSDLRAVLRDGKLIERTLEHDDGAVQLVRCLPYRIEGVQIHGVVITLVDVTELEQARRALTLSEQRLASLMSATQEAIVELDAQGCWRLGNETSLRLLGFDQAPVGRPLHDLLHPSCVDPEGCRLKHALEGKVSLTDETLPLQRRDGAQLYARCWSRSEAERPEVRVLTLLDYTERRQREQKTEAAIADRDRFIGMLSHELRNPLSVINNATSVLALKDKDEVVARVVGRISRQTHYMRDLLDDLLEFIRIRENKLSIELAVCSAQLAVDQVCGDFAEQAAEQGQEIVVSHSDQELFVLGDQQRLRQVLSNLLRNAIKYSSGAGQIRVSTQLAERSVQIAVADEGEGMSEAVVSRVFDAFFQRDDSLDRSAGGIGLGLTLVRELVELMGGSVQASSPGSKLGSTFTLLLPSVKSQVLPEVTRSPVSELPFRSVVIIEDVEDARDSLLEIFEALDIHARAAADGATGLALVRELRPDVALLDIGLPGMSGHQVAERVRQEKELDRTCLVALTGYGANEDRRQARAAGFDLHLTKPFEVDQLRLIAETYQTRQAGGATLVKTGAAYP